MKQKKSWMPVIILLIFGCLFTAGGIYYLYFYNYDAVERQNTEEDLADCVGGFRKHGQKTMAGKNVSGAGRQ